MKKILNLFNKKTFLIALILSVSFAFNFSSAFAIQIEKTSDTAVAAKSDALNEAKRIAFASVLGEHVSVDMAKQFADEISGEELNGLVDTILIEGEKSDATSYSADIIVQFQNSSLDKWLESRGIMGVQSAPVAAGRAPVFLELNGLDDFATVMKTSRETGTDLKIVGISGGRVSAHVRENIYEIFVLAVRSAGVTVSY